MTESEQHLLQWLAEADPAQYGECHGPTLDSLIAKGLARVLGKETELINPFIAKGQGIMYRAVELTDAGWRLINA
jgi:hypothetical protein